MKNTVLLLLLGLSATLTAQPGNPFSLEAAIEYAYQNNHAVRNAQINIADAETQIDERRAGALPQVNGSAAYTRYLKLPAQALPDAFVQLIAASNGGELPPDFSREVSFFLKNNFTTGVGVNQALFDGSIFTALQAAHDYRSYVLAELEVVKQDIRNQVITAYLGPLILEENAEFLQKNIDNVSGLLRETRALYEAGFVEQLDVDRLQLSLSNLQTELDNLQRQRLVALNFLKMAMGYPIEDPITIEDDLDALLEVASDESVLAEERSYGNRAEYAVITLGEQLNQANIRNIKSGYLPTLYGNAGYQWQFQSNTSDDAFWAETASIGVNLNVPIFDGFRRRSQVERAELQAQLLTNQREQLQRSIDLEVANARESYRNAAQRIEFQRSNLELASRIYETARIKYKEGVGSSIEVQQAEQSLFATQQNYTQAAYDLVVAKSDLDRALGN